MEKPTCRWPGCDGPIFGHGLCARDYQRARSINDFDSPWAVWRDGRSREPTTCRWPGCAVSNIMGRSLCKTHYHRAYRIKDFDSPWVAWAEKYPDHCIWPDCKSSIYARKFCVTHYYRADVVEDFATPWVAWAQRSARTCRYCKGGFIATSTAAIYCSKTCARYGWARENPERNERSARANRDKRRARLRDVTAERVTVEEIRLASGDVCYLCGVAVDFKLKHPHPMSPSIDHVTPLSRGGRHVLDNLAMTHLRCNLRKHNNPAVNGRNATLFTP